MKKIFLISLATLFFVTTQAQDCHYKVNELDKFTGKYTKITKPEDILPFGSTSAKFSVKKIDTTYSFILNYELLKTLMNGETMQPYSIEMGAKLIFLLEDGTVINLTSNDNIRGRVSKIQVQQLVSNWACYLDNCEYSLTKSQVEAFFKSKVKSMRFYRTESNGKEDYIDADIKPKRQDNIQELIRCVF